MTAGLYKRTGGQFQVAVAGAGCVECMSSPRCGILVAVLSSGMAVQRRETGLLLSRAWRRRFQGGERWSGFLRFQIMALG